MPLSCRFLWRKIYGSYCWGREWLPLTIWLLLQCLLRRKKAVLICRFGAMGDVVCTLPLCDALRDRHPDQLIVFVTSSLYKNLVKLSGTADLVYGSKLWVWPFVMPSRFNVFGLVAAVYNPQNSDEVSERSASILHLVNEFAASCGVSLNKRQPHLYPSDHLIRTTRRKYGLGEQEVGTKKIIAINGGPTWPVRMWETPKWQTLIDHIHAEHDAVILQFGQRQTGKSSDLENLTGVVSLFDHLKPEEIVALIAVCDLVVAIDSGPVHIAAALGTPIVGLYGAVRPSFSLPPDSPSIGLVSDVECLYCNHRSSIIHWKEGCPYDIKCMKQLEVQSVIEAVDTLLRGRGRISSV